MTTKVYKTHDPFTKREWYYEVRRIFGRTEYRHVHFDGAWSPCLMDARRIAQSTGWFRYDDEGPLVCCTL